MRLNAMHSGTLLHLAAICDHAGVAALLLDHGASVDFRDSDGRNALSLAVELESKSVIDVLER